MRVVIADDAVIVREGLRSLLAGEGIETVGEASEPAGLLRLVALEQPDAAVVDIRMPPTHTDEGIVAAEKIRVRYPKTAVLVLSQYVAATYAQRLLEDNTAGRRLPAQGPGQRGIDAAGRAAPGRGRRMRR